MQQRRAQFGPEPTRQPRPLQRRLRISDALAGPVVPVRLQAESETESELESASESDPTQ